MRQGHAEDTGDSMVFNKLQVQLKRERLFHSHLTISHC